MPRPVQSSPTAEFIYTASARSADRLIINPNLSDPVGPHISVLAQVLHPLCARPIVLHWPFV
jgi:hypothetical protein